MSRFTNDVDAVGEMLSNTVVQLIAGVLTFRNFCADAVHELDLNRRNDRNGTVYDVRSQKTAKKTNAK